MKKQKILIIMIMLSLAMCLNACGKKTGTDAQEEAGRAETAGRSSLRRMARDPNQK